jgi:hypothetical protein
MVIAKKRSENFFLSEGRGAEGGLWRHTSDDVRRCWLLVGAMMWDVSGEEKKLPLKRSCGQKTAKNGLH